MNIENPIFEWISRFQDGSDWINIIVKFIIVCGSNSNGSISNMNNYLQCFGFDMHKSSDEIFRVSDIHSSQFLVLCLMKNFKNYHIIYCLHSI